MEAVSEAFLNIRSWHFFWCKAKNNVENGVESIFSANKRIYILNGLKLLKFFEDIDFASVKILNYLEYILALK